jgi:hypothetical protein
MNDPQSQQQVLKLLSTITSESVSAITEHQGL